MTGWIMTKTSIRFRARQALLVLLVFSAVEYRYMHADLSGAAPSGCGLNRLERDLTRRIHGAAHGAAVAPQSPSTAS